MGLLCVNSGVRRSTAPIPTLVMGLLRVNIGVFSNCQPAVEPVTLVTCITVVLVTTVTPRLIHLHVQVYFFAQNTMFLHDSLYQIIQPLLDDSARPLARQTTIKSIASITSSTEGMDLHNTMDT
jgi:hypothetical protein